MALDKFGALAQVLAGESVATKAFSLGNNARDSKQKRYATIMRGVNVSSYSTQNLMHACPRKLILQKLELGYKYDNKVQGFQVEANIDFAFGRAVESGVQAVLLGKSDAQIFFDMFIAWDIPIFHEHDKGYPKSFLDAMMAVDKFKSLKIMLFAGWGIAMVNGKPAIELALCMDMENGYYYVGHCDIVLYSPSENRYRVLEIKTDGAKFLHEAKYKNSDQAIGYSIFLDNIAKDEEATRSFEIFYIVFNTVKDDWILYQFTKSRSQRAEWINTLIQDNQITQMYVKTKHFPKRGATCLQFNRVCKYIDSCDLSFESFNPKGIPIVPVEEMYDDSENYFDFRFKLSEIIATQTEML